MTLAKTCEATTEMRECRAPRDWSLLALQNIRTGKSHYLVICRCSDNFHLEGPMAHDQPTYASVPGIRVFGMMCVKPGASTPQTTPLPVQTYPNKRYQEQNPIAGVYVKPNGQNSHKINNISLPPFRPTIDNLQQKYQSSTYNYLKRPGSVIINNKQQENSPETFATFSYGRNQNDDHNNDEALAPKTNERTKRSINDDDDDDNNLPPFPTEKVHEFYDSIVWDDDSA